eukprot:TRINITY_DN13484_c0_g2_i1.p1 TRINITY_DN13484_c0_g2~~TRINITY_DN13484_c0_g2_i1.p1  ORF type:complete len:273 (+),score=53.15 TRINITY_DN13484_c0_g2_i1:84-902(+)
MSIEQFYTLAAGSLVVAFVGFHVLLLLHLPLRTGLTLCALGTISIYLYARSRGDRTKRATDALLKAMDGKDVDRIEDACRWVQSEGVSFKLVEEALNLAERLRAIDHPMANKVGDDSHVEESISRAHIIQRRLAEACWYEHFLPMIGQSRSCRYARAEIDKARESGEALTLQGAIAYAEESGLPWQEISAARLLLRQWLSTEIFLALYIGSATNVHITVKTAARAGVALEELEELMKRAAVEIKSKAESEYSGTEYGDSIRERLQASQTGGI